MKMVGDLLRNFINQMGFFSDGSIDWVKLGLRLVMIVVAIVLIFLAIKKDFEPYLLIPIGVGMLLANLAPGLFASGANGESMGLLYSFHKGIEWEIFPPLIFLGIGATTDFGPLISRPSSLLLGAAAQIGIFITFFGALLLGFNALEASAIGIIGGVFDRLRGTWMLTSIQTIPIPQSSNASFLAFYRQFASDPEFQTHSLSESIKFEGPDPDDDFARMEGEITPDTWEAFAPDLPKKMIFNVIYGQPHQEGNRKLFVLRGIANGLELEMTFQRKGGAWKLTKLTT